jgi:large subunit ribosomal protein L3
MQGLIGRKLGMTQVFDAEGRQVAVTVLEVGPCVVVQRKTRERDGYEAVQLGFDDQKAHRLTRPALGRFVKLNLAPKRVLREFALEPGDACKPGDVLTASLFDAVPYVDVVGVSKGRGFAGVMRRHGMLGGPMTHGSTSKRRIGAIGQRAKPGGIAKGHRMPGQMGHVRVTQQSLRVVQVRAGDNLLLVAGAVPGPSGGTVIVRKALKRKEAPKPLEAKQAQKADKKGAKAAPAAAESKAKKK